MKALFEFEFIPDWVGWFRFSRLGRLTLLVLILATISGIGAVIRSTNDEKSATIIHQAK